VQFGNWAHYGGGIATAGAGTSLLTNVTVSGNFAAFGGGLANVGGIAVSIYYRDPTGGTATLRNVTVSGNSATTGGGLENRGTMALTNTIVAGNAGGADVSGAVTGANNLIGGDALLAPLGDYGGTTQTMPLLPGSPAIDAGASAAGVPATDQRGKARVGSVDIGAFESQGFALTPAAGSTPQSATAGTAFAHPLALTVTANNPAEPVNGGVISFAAPTMGATARLSAPAATVSGGQAAITAVAIILGGSYDVSASASGASAATFQLTNEGGISPLQVNSPLDIVDPNDDVNSLREAIAYANAHPSADTITFTSLFDTPQVISLTLGQLVLTDTATTTIAGPGANRLSVSGGNVSRVFEVDFGASAAFAGLTITGGNGGGFGGGVLNLGSATLSGCTVSGNSAGYGGGLNNYGTMDLTDCTVSGNSASGGGGGLSNYGRTRVTGTTISGNSAAKYGGGVFSWFEGELWITNATISGNSAKYGGGLMTAFGSTATLANVIVAGNTQTSGGDLADFSGGVSGSNNLIGDGTGSGFANGAAGNLVGIAANPVNSLLAPLGDHGGPTQTMPLLPGSPAINAGSNALVSADVTTDQRGSGFARISAGVVDIGACEVQAPTITRKLGAVTVDEGVPASNSGAFDDAQGRNTVTLTVSLGSMTQDDATGAWGWSYTPPDGPGGPTTVTITATDDYGMTATTTFLLTVNNVAPTASITGVPVSGHSPEGTAISLGSSVTDPSPVDTSAGFTYVWSVTKNGSDYASGTEASFRFTPDDNGTYVVTLIATDKDGGASQPASATITVDNVAPTAGVSGPSDGVRGQARTFTLTVTDASSVDQAAGFTFAVTWGDGSSQTVSGPSGTTVSHTYTANGAYAVKVTAKDKDGGTSAAASQLDTITAVALETDPTDPSKTALFVGGTTGADTIIVKPADANGTLNVKIGITMAYS
jgi:hypothetical protein